MSRNIEIKARYDDPETALEKIKKLSCTFVGLDKQKDTFFHVADGRMKLRESSLSGANLIPYLRKNQPGPRPSEYMLVPVPDASKFKRLMERILGVAAVVEKERHIYLYQNVRIHLDRVKHLGTFIEFEAVLDENHSDADGKKKIEFLMSHFGITPKDLVAEAYVDLLTR